ncbi:MAG TPA: FG-GAP-like repeat-containing protein, partial [Lacunisphaera sp.]|nr:FG-GAP-like repeat-containing protein [Lacunisphaera sp.]
APTLAARANVWKNSAPRRESTLAYRNLGGLQFSDVSREWGLDQVGVSFGCALADLDGDGDLDLVYANYDAPPSIIRNDTVGGHRVVIKLAGAGGNPAGIGAELQLETSAGVQMRQLYTERGIVASEPALVHFGLGDETVVRKLTIRWPRGQVQELENLPADQLLTIKEPELPQGFKPAPAVFNQAPRADALLAEKAAARGLKYTVRLRPYDEFIGQRLLPRRLNGQSPALATADVNGDGHADLFVSGSTGQAGQLFLGQAGGAFAPAADQPWSTVAEADDTGAVFLDVNGDGHLDLFISAGGVQHPPGDPLFNDRLYLNDGRGRFGAAAAGALPADGESTGAAAAADFDGDGRADLFVGGRTVAGRYPETPRSFLYRNDGGKLVDVTDAVAPGLRAIGLVTAAVWSDVDGDKRPDLVVATEWGPVTVFRNNGRTLTAAPLGTDTGWWSALAVADVNGDGRPDIVAGNTGLNTKYHASASAPTELYAGDFDGSGRSHLIEAQYEGGKLVPVRGRSKLAYPFPWLTRKFPTFKAFAEASLSDIFGADKLAGVKRLTATELSSGVFLQQADGAFRFAPLPRSAQIAPVNAIVARDFDGDRHLDLLLFGNNFGPEPTTGRFDGGLGVLLKGDGKGGFAALNAAQSGVVVTGEARAAAVLPGPQGDRIVVACNQGPLLLLERK